MRGSESEAFLCCLVAWCEAKWHSLCTTYVKTVQVIGGRRERLEGRTMHAIRLEDLFSAVEETRAVSIAH